MREEPGREKVLLSVDVPLSQGRLHMGHVRNYTIGDVIARYQRMLGKNVLQPMGWDAFGLPAENAAMASGVAPAQWTFDNIAYMKKQLRLLGFAVDWEREVATCQPEYYRWNQWLFLRMLEKGHCLPEDRHGQLGPDGSDRARQRAGDRWSWLAHRRAGREARNPDVLPGDHPVRRGTAGGVGSTARLARTGQADAEKLDRQEPRGTDRLSAYGGRGRHSLGVHHPRRHAHGRHLTSPWPPNIPGPARRANQSATGCVHRRMPARRRHRSGATQEKKGMPTGLAVTHPPTGELLPLWVANYVLMGYGEGAVMAVPATTSAISSSRTNSVADQAGDSHPRRRRHARAVAGRLRRLRAVHQFRQYDGLDFEQAVDAIAADLKRQGLGEKKEIWRLRDWGISRQRYWGTPIPIIHCQDCGAVPVPDADLPVVLPGDLIPDGSGNPLNKYAEFLDCACPRCGKPARRETDTMDTFVDSSWYFSSAIARRARRR